MSSRPSSIGYKAIKHYQPNFIMKLLGIKNRSNNKKRYEFTWGTIEFKRALTFSILEFDSSEREYSNETTWYLSIGLLFVSLWLHLPKFLPHRKFGDELGQDTIRSWGVGFANEEFSILTIHTGIRTRYIEFPWYMVFYQQYVFMEDGTWLALPWRGCAQPREVLLESIEKHRYQETVKYKYISRSGKVQKVDATITVSENHLRARWLQWTSLFSNITRVINVSFSSGIGEKADDWKGGTIGCSYNMREDEHPVETLLRMENTRKF